MDNLQEEDIDYKQKNTVPNLYALLGIKQDVCNDPDCDRIIKKAYNTKSKVVHPDKNPNNPEMALAFKMITMAYDVLSNKEQRERYNNKLVVEKQAYGNDFASLKGGAKAYSDATGGYLGEPNDVQKISFKDKMKELDEKHGYDDLNSGAMSKTDASKRLKDLTDARNADLNIKPNKLFDGSFDNAKFQAAWDHVHKGQNQMGIKEHQGLPGAWNAAPTGSVSARYCDFDKMGTLYSDDMSRMELSHQPFGSVRFGKEGINLTAEDVQNMKGADYVAGHNELGDDYYKDMKERLNARKSDATSFDKMSYGDYSRDTAGYGIFDKLGLDISDVNSDFDSLTTQKRMERLMHERQKQDSDHSSPNPGSSNKKKAPKTSR